MSIVVVATGADVAFSMRALINAINTTPTNGPLFPVDAEPMQREILLQPDRGEDAVDSTAHVVIDLIYDLVHPNGRIPSCAQQVEARRVLSTANQAVAYARKRGWPVVFVTVGFLKGYSDQPKASPLFGQVDQLGALALDEIGTSFHPDLNVAPGDMVLAKPRISPFYGTRLEAILRANQIGCIVFAGVTTTWAIQAAARDAHDRDYRVLILEDACADDTEEEHNTSIAMLKQIATITSVRELVSH